MIVLVETERLSPVQVDAVARTVLPVVGAVHPDGMVMLACEPVSKAALAVKVNVKLLPELPAVTLLGFTTIVPSPFAAPTIRVAENVSAGASCWVAVTL